jgi:hypothetical protein
MIEAGQHHEAIADSIEWIQAVYEDLPLAMQRVVTQPDPAISAKILSLDYDDWELLQHYRVGQALHDGLLTIPNIGRAWARDLAIAILALAIENKVVLSTVIIDHANLLNRASPMRKLTSLLDQTTVRDPNRAIVRAVREWWVEQKRADS